MAADKSQHEWYVADRSKIAAVCKGVEQEDRSNCKLYYLVRFESVNVLVGGGAPDVYTPILVP